MAKITNPSKLLPAAKSTAITKVGKSGLISPININKKSTAIVKSNDVGGKLVNIEKFLKSDLIISQKKAEVKRKEKQKQNFEAAEKKLETPKSKGLRLPGISAPSLGFLDRVKRFLFFTALGWLLPKILEFLPKLEGFAKIVGGIYKFGEGLFGSLFNGFMSLVKFGGDLKDKTIGFLAELNVGKGANFQKEFDKLEKQFNTFVNASIIAGVLAADVGGAAVDEYNKWRKKNEGAAGTTGAKLGTKAYAGRRLTPQELKDLKLKPGSTEARAIQKSGTRAQRESANQQRRIEGAQIRAKLSEPKPKVSWWDKLTGGIKGKFGKVAGKLAGPFSKFAGAAIPGLGAALGAEDSKARFKAGDKLGGFLAGLSASLDAFTAAVAIAGLGAAATGVGLPGAAVLATIATVAGAISVSIDVVLLIRDILKAFGVPVFNKGGRVVRRYQGGGTTRGGRPVGGAPRRTIAPVTRRKPPRVSIPKVQPGKDVGGEKKIKEFYAKPEDPSKRYLRPAGGWLSTLFDGEKKDLSAFDTLKKMSGTLKSDETLAKGILGLMSSGIDMALGQKLDRKILKSVFDSIGYVADTLASQRANMSMSSLMSQLRGFAEGGTVPSRGLRGTYGDTGTGDLLAKLIGPTIDQRVNEAIQSIEKELMMKSGKKDGAGPGGPDDIGPIDYRPLPLQMTQKQAFATIYELAKKNGAEMPELVAGMAMHESGYLSSQLAREANNPFGQSGTGNRGSIRYKNRQWAAYNSLDDAVKWHIENWHNDSRFGKGAGTYDSAVDGLRAILPIYAPTSDGNNHSNYIKSVSSTLSTMGFDPQKKNPKVDLSTQRLVQQRRPTAPGTIPGTGGARGNIIGKNQTVIVEGQFRLRPDAATKYLEMKDAAKQDGVNLTLESAWRDSSKQAILYQAYLNGTGNLAAPPGSSNHERGISIDLRSGIPWAQRNCTRFGWSNTGMTFSQKEPWHFDFVGGGVQRPSQQPPQSPPGQPPRPSTSAINTSGMSGPQIAAKIRNIKPGQKVVFPGVGSVQGGKDWMNRSQTKYFDPQGKPLTEAEFTERLRKKNQSQPSQANKPPGPVPAPNLPGRFPGGTIEGLQQYGALQKQGGGLIAPSKSNRPNVASHTSYNHPASNSTILIQPMIYYVDRPTSSGNSMIAFPVPIAVNSSTPDLSSMRG